MAQQDLYIAAANIYVGGTAPAIGAIITVDSSGVPSTAGTNVGLTGGPAVFRVAGDIHEISVEQALSPVKIRKTSEEVEVEFSIKEIDFAKLKRFLNGSMLTTDATSTPQTNKVTGGGDACINTFPVVLVTKEPCGTPAYYTMISLYKAYMSDDFEIEFGKDSESMVKVTLRGLADTTRPVGDQTYQIVQQRAVA